MKFALCNEVIRDLGFEDQCALAAGLGYDGLEIAPLTLAHDPARIPTDRRRTLRHIAEDAECPVTGLHYLLASPEGLSITSSDPQVHGKTRDHMLRMVELCVDLGGRVLVHGSPAQRRLEDGESPQHARANADKLFAAAGEAAHAAGVTYCIEPLSPKITDFVTSLAEAKEILDRLSSPGLASMIDTLAAWQGETEAPAALLRRHLRSGIIKHVHLNDTNSRAPGQGEHSFLPIIQELLAQNYSGVVGIEPFDYHPDGPTAAAFAIGYLRGLLETGQDRN